MWSLAFPCSAFFSGALFPTSVLPVCRVDSICHSRWCTWHCGTFWCHTSDNSHFSSLQLCCGCIVSSSWCICFQGDFRGRIVCGVCFPLPLIVCLCRLCRTASVLSLLLSCRDTGIGWKNVLPHSCMWHPSWHCGEGERDRDLLGCLPVRGGSGERDRPCGSNLRPRSTPRARWSPPMWFFSELDM